MNNYSLIEKSKAKQQLTSLLGVQIEIKSLFMIHGVFMNDIMFAIYVDKQFHLKASGKLAKILEKLGAIVWYYSTRKNMQSKEAYYRLPEHIYKDEKLLSRLIKLAISQIRAKQEKQNQSQKSQIRNLPNLSVKFERALAKVGIFTADDLQRIGAIQAFVMLKESGKDVGISWFWNLLASSKNKFTQLLTQEEKTIALEELNKELSKSELRAIKVDEK